MTVVARRIIASPARSASEAWEVIVKLIAPEANSTAKKELLSITGIACSLIADEAMKTAPIIVYGSGPRARFYCLYDEDAINGDDAKEDPLLFDPTEDEWQVSLPCPADDLTWVQASLKKISGRVTARNMASGTEIQENDNDNTMELYELDREAFFRS